MKYIFSLLFVFSFNISFCQMNVSELLKVYKMDLDQFETYALQKGYQFYKIHNDENTNGNGYKRYTKDGTKYLTLYNKFYDAGKNVTYQTSNTNEFLTIKNQLKRLRFNQFSADHLEDDDKTTVHIKKYRNSVWEIQLYTGNNGNYEIGLNKF